MESLKGEKDDWTPDSIPSQAARKYKEGLKNIPPEKI